MRLRSLQMIFDENISPDSVRSGVCADWKDDRNGAARLPAQEAEGKQEELLPPIHVGKKPEERVAQTQQLIEEETSASMICQQQGKLVPVAQFALTCGAFEAFDSA